MDRTGHLYDVCKIGQGRDCCRYIIGDGKGLHCAKLAVSLKEEIDRRVLFNAMTARADNCAGRPLEDVL